MDFDTFLDQAWNEHATHPARVAARLQPEGLALVQTDEQVAQLAFLAQHVQGLHLGRWGEALALQQALAALPVVAADGSTAQALQRHRTALRLAAGEPGVLPADTPPAERARFDAQVGALLTFTDAPRASALLLQAEAACAALPDADPAVRALAVSANNTAGHLHDETTLSPAQVALMLQAAHQARRAWARAGTWLEVERADYRLALSCARAGALGEARAHAQACLAAVQAQEPPAPALEFFFAWEALARVAAAAGDETGRATAVAAAAAAFPQLSEADRGWCAATLKALQTPPAAAEGAKTGP
ncbi:hypothetical protein [Rubrivivax rivuli]|uniref:Uncharacterized protein n=1 Tax=Rubrivivax rivuli TaxID=1862385 RepID=A0A437RCH4_9BURK|nr:hypothetical protein [Rubrivivax rivuli]RVU44490.1 hypothetical protein EOE66_17665 [Rubrivivax rivuli]